MGLPASASIPAIVPLACVAMGTRFEFVLAGDDETHLRAVGEAAIEEVHDLHRRLSYFDSSSMVSRLNRQAGQRAVHVDRELFDLLVMCRDVWRDSHGAFDITIAPLMHEHGFRSREKHSVPVLSDHANVGMNLIELDERELTVRYLHPDVCIDLGAIAKGYALDVAAAVVREYGVTCGLLHGGTSTVVGIGAPPGMGGWRIALAAPAADGTDCVRHDSKPWSTSMMTLKNRALSVSAPTGRMVERKGKLIGHVIDPRTKRPAEGARVAAVIGESAALCDAWSTALLVLRERPSTCPESLETLICNTDSQFNQTHTTLCCVPPTFNCERPTAN